MARWMVFILQSSVLLSTGCGATESDDTASTPTFTDIQEQILVPTCSFSSCHGSGTGGLMIAAEQDNYASLVNASSVGAPGRLLVVPGNADESYLVWKLEGNVGIAGTEMPQGGALEAESIAMIRDWIDAGALHD